MDSSRAAKKRRFFAPPPKDSEPFVKLQAAASADAAQVTVLHQHTHLSWVFFSPSSTTHQQQSDDENQSPARWHGRGETTLYLIHETTAAATNPATNTTTAPTAASCTQGLALHLRGGVSVEKVQVQAVVANHQKKKDANPTQLMQLTDLASQVAMHSDPLEHVLIRPPTTYSMDDNNNSQGKNNNNYRMDADAQSVRGAAGMTHGLRAASIASAMGELKLTYDLPNDNNHSAAARPGQDAAMTPAQFKALANATAVWQGVLQQPTTTASKNNNNDNNNNSNHKKKRMTHVANVLATHSASPTNTTALRVTIQFVYETTARMEAQAQEINHSDNEPAPETNQSTTANVVMDKEELDTTTTTTTTTTKQNPNKKPASAPPLHRGGLHILTQHQNQRTKHATAEKNEEEQDTSARNAYCPHIYTTSGTYGDHEGPRCWVPCLDSAAAQHRASHEFSISVTGGLRHGLRAFGMGQDFGTSRAYLHSANAMKLTTTTTGNSNDKNDLAANAQRLLGKDHIEFLQRVQSIEERLMQKQQQQQQPGHPTTNAHIIPPEGAGAEAMMIDDENNPESPPVLSLDDVNVTSIWCSASWTPMPIRSMGFAVGPFRILEDSEYFGISAMAQVNHEDDDDDDGDNGNDDGNDDSKPSLEARHRAHVERARRNGEGIRQAYLAPTFERKHIHAKASRELLPHAKLQLRPLTSEQWQTLHHMDKAVEYATVGVPHRALSLMRDILAFSAYRTSSYVQIWIPNAIHGGSTSGALHCCPEVLVNPFLGGSIMDSRLLAPVQSRLPYHQGGRTLQFLQARNCVRGWIVASVPLGGGGDDVGNGYILRLFEALFMSLYERGHGAFGEGGARGGVYFTRRFAANSGLGSNNLDFLPVRNMEDIAMMDDMAGAVPLDENQTDYLWRSATNGTESHTSAIDEFNVRHLMCKDVVEVVERGADKDKQLPSPGMGWSPSFGSYLSATFLSSNASSSSHLGCGAVDMMHPIGGLVYRSMKMDAFRGVVEGRAGIANFVRLIRATFVAAHLHDIGEKKLVLPKRKKKAAKDNQREEGKARDKQDEEVVPPFVVCVNEILSKKGLTHTLFTRALQNMSGRYREALLAGTLVDVERNAEDPRTKKAFVDPEGFPNSYVRAPSTMYCRVGVQVEQQTRDTGGSSTSKSIHCQLYAEPVIPEGGVAFSGPVTVRVVENEGQFREYEKDLTGDGSRRDWGSMALHAKPVSTPQAQAQASGSLESKSAKGGSGDRKMGTSIFSETNFHQGGYQAIELVRLTNLTPLLWCRVDPNDLYGGRIAITQPDAMFSEQLFYDGDAGAQVDAIRALAERPLTLALQSSMRVTVVHGVNVSELPVRVLGDCLRGSSALTSCLPHTPCVRQHAALAIAQWQNNKGPASRDAVGTDSWLGLGLLKTYFQERFCSNSIVMPVKFSRVVVKNSEAEARGSSNAEGGTNAKSGGDEAFDYLDALDEGEDRDLALSRAEDVETEEDEEYRVRSACISAISSIRAQDGQTPEAVTKFMESILEGEDAAMKGNFVCPDDELKAEREFQKLKASKETEVDFLDELERIPTPSLSYNSGMLVADTLLALCNLNSWPTVYTDPATGRKIQASGKHPVTKLLELAQLWVDWGLYREKTRYETESETATMIGGNCHDVVTACAIIASANLAIFRQCTSAKPADVGEEAFGNASTAEYYTNIMDAKPTPNDLTRAAAAQAMTCICCAADRLEVDGTPAVGLLSALEYLLDKIVDEDTSPPLRQTLALIMMDACTGKVASMQRVGAIGGRNDLYTSGSRFFCGPLGTSHGNDKGSALLTTVAAASSPAATAVNDGARRGVRLLNRAGHPKDGASHELVVRVAQFATRLWRVINGEPPDPPSYPTSGPVNGVCAYDGALRCSMLTLFQWLWPKGCFAALQVQSWKSRENTPEYKKIGADLVMKISEEEKAAALAEESSLSDISRLVLMEIDRQAWRGEMAVKSYNMYKASGASKNADAAAAEQGIGQPLPPIQRDAAFKSGGWIASHAQQRRALALDGGTAVTKLRLKVGGAK